MGDGSLQLKPPIVVTAATADTANAADRDGDVWEPLSRVLPVDAARACNACVIASAIAAGDHPSSEFRVKRVLVANPEYRTVSVIATALAAGALEKSSFTVKNIYKMKEEGSHAA
ncbi:MAG: hypothetical protein ACLTSX_08030 [Collinsella sp.]